MRTDLFFRRAAVNLKKIKKIFFMHNKSNTGLVK